MYSARGSSGSSKGYWNSSESICKGFVEVFVVFPTTACRNIVCLFGKIRASSEYSFRETVALEKPDVFFTFLDRLTDSEAHLVPADMTPKAIHQAALQIALDNGILEETGSLSAVELNLALHAATPKLEAFYNHYEDHHNNSQGTQCGSWVDWYGEVVCDANRLAQLAEVETKFPGDLKSYVLFCRLASFCYGSQAGIQFRFTNKTQNPDF